MTAADHKIEDLRAEMGPPHLTPLWEIEAEIMGLPRSPEPAAALPLGRLPHRAAGQ